jgi:hypothetical protein
VNEGIGPPIDFPWPPTTGASLQHDDSLVMCGDHDVGALVSDHVANFQDREAG